MFVFFALLLVPAGADAFTTSGIHSSFLHRRSNGAAIPSLRMAVTDPDRVSNEDDDAVQWGLFTKHQAKGSWRGTWTSYDYMGDIVDSTIASVDLVLDKDQNTVTHTHQIVVDSKTSDCDWCFDSTQTKTLLMATYAPGQLRKNRCASVAMVCGPSLLRSGAMSTELILSHGDGRVRVIYQHAPVWEAGVEPGSCPPQGLKLFRTLVSREALRPGPPTRQSEETNPPPRGNPRFFRPVPPFQWHAKWSGTSWTWGPATGDRGWAIVDMEEVDAWHGRPTGDTMDVWAMRLPGGILVQCPRVIRSGETGLCRLAWLPEEDGDGENENAMLLRVEASVLALEPMIDEEMDAMVGFHPPSLGSLRCDVLRKSGELEGANLLDRGAEGAVLGPRDEKTKPSATPPTSPPSPVADAVENKRGKEEADTRGSDDNSGKSGLEAVRKALNL